MSHINTRTFIFFLCCIAALNACSQNTVFVRGIIKDLSTAKPIPYANIVKKPGKIAVVANSEGIFQLSASPTESDSVSFSSIGYRTLVVPFDKLIQTDTAQIILVPEIYGIGAVSVSAGLTPMAIIKKTKAAIPENYYQNACQINGYYREYTKENENYGRLVEALVSVYSNRSGKRDTEDFKVNALKKSAAYINCFPEAKKENHLYALFADDPIRHKGLFASGELEKMTFKMDSLCYFDNEPCYAISFTSPAQNGSLLIDQMNYAVLYLQTLRKYYYSVPGDTLRFGISYSYTIRNRKYNGKLFASSINNVMTIEDFDAAGNLRKLEVSSEFMAGDIAFTDGKIPDATTFMNKNKDVFLQYVPFNCDAFEKANILLPTAVQRQIK